MEVLTYYDFFAGVGMVNLALAPEWQCIWANDYDPKKATIYRANHDQRAFSLGDIADVAAADLPQGATLAWASFPCQDLSLAGLRRGISAHRSGVFWEFYRVIGDLMAVGRRPPVIILENVLGLLRKADFELLCEALEALNMRYGALVVNANRFVPQSRPRVFMIAVDSRVDCSGLVDTEPSEHWSTRSLVEVQSGLANSVARNWCWWTLPLPDEPPESLDAVLEVEQHGFDWHTNEETARLLGMMSPANLRKVHCEVQRQGATVGFLYKRTRQGRQRAEVRFDGIAGCLRTPAGGSSRQTVMIIRDGEVRTRLITAREAARLMGVADTFRLPDSYSDAYHAMGDGVVVPVASWIKSHLLTPLAHRSSEFVGS